jgi:hypothetical protein
VLLIWQCYWIISYVFLYSVGDLKKRNDYTPFAAVEWSDFTRYVIFYDIFGLFWVNAFLIGAQQFIIAFACVNWYFTASTDTFGSGSTLKGVYVLLRYHLGTVAFGSLVIAICQMIRFLFEYYRKKMTGAVFANPVGKFILWGTRYCLDCLNRFVKFISKNAYIMCAITSRNFCSSAWRAFILILASAGRFLVSNLLGASIMWLGRAFTAIATATFGYIMVAYIPSVKEDLSSPLMPVVLMGLIGFVVGSVFLSLFSFSLDTILLCFLVDEAWAEHQKMDKGKHRPEELDAFANSGKSGFAKCCFCC